MILFNWKLTPRLIFSGACEGQMPEILSMIQVDDELTLSEKNVFVFQTKRMTPAPSVLSMVNNFYQVSLKCICVAGDLVLLLPLLFQHLCPDELCWLCHLGISHPNTNHFTKSQLSISLALVSKYHKDTTKKTKTIH